MWFIPRSLCSRILRQYTHTHTFGHPFHHLYARLCACHLLLMAIRTMRRRATRRVLCDAVGDDRREDGASGGSRTLYVEIYASSLKKAPGEETSGKKFSSRDFSSERILVFFFFRVFTIINNVRNVLYTGIFASYRFVLFCFFLYMSSSARKFATYFFLQRRRHNTCNYL